MSTKKEQIQNLVDGILAAMQDLDATDQTIAVAIFRALGEGRPVAKTEVARRTALPASRVEETLHSWSGVLYDDEDRIIGFWGLSIPEMPHRLTLGTTSVHNWCAWDPLFIVPLLGTSGRVESNDPVSGETVTIDVTPDGVDSVSPPGAQVSFLTPEDTWDENVVHSFCHYVLFFASRESGERWTAEHPGTFLLSVEEAFEVGRQTNANKFSAAVG